MKWALAFVAGLMLGISACGGGGDTKYGKTYVEHAVPGAVRNSDGGTFTDISCSKQSEATFRCLGKYTPSREAIRERCGERCIPADIDDMRGQHAEQPATLYVTVDPTDGSFIYEFRQ